MAKKENTKIHFKNKKAYHKYEILDKFLAGIRLLGTEIKSIRTGKVNFTDAYCSVKDDEVWLIGLHIAEYRMGTCNNHEPKRQRKLLLNKREIKKIEKTVTEKGLTIVPLSVFINEKGLAKVEIAVAKGKKIFDKRESIKERDSKIVLDRMKKYK